MRRLAREHNKFFWAMVRQYGSRNYASTQTIEKMQQKQHEEYIVPNDIFESQLEEFEELNSGKVVCLQKVKSSVGDENPVNTVGTQPTERNENEKCKH